MKKIKGSEVIDGINNLIRAKEQEIEQLQALSNDVYNVINSDNSFQDSDYNSIIEQLATFHTKASSLFNAFIKEYEQALKDVKKSVEIYAQTNEFVHTDFLSEQAINSLGDLSDKTNDIVDDINEQYKKISDLVVDGQVSTYYLNLYTDNAIRHAEKTISELDALDKENVSRLAASENSLKNLSQFITKAEPQP